MQKDKERQGKERSSIQRVEIGGESDSGGSLWLQVSNQWGLWSVCLCQPWLSQQYQEMVVHPEKQQTNNPNSKKRGAQHNPVQMHLIGPLLSGLRNVQMDLAFRKWKPAGIAVAQSQPKCFIVTLICHSLDVHHRYQEKTLWIRDTGNHKKRNFAEKYKLQGQDRRTLENYKKIFECKNFQLLLTTDGFHCVYLGCEDARIFTDVCLWQHLEYDGLCIRSLVIFLCLVSLITAW